MTTHPTAISPEGYRIGAGFAEFLHGVGHGDLDGPNLIAVPGYPNLLCNANCPECKGSGEYHQTYDYGQTETLACRCVRSAECPLCDSPEITGGKAHPECEEREYARAAAQNDQAAYDDAEESRRQSREEREWDR